MDGTQNTAGDITHAISITVEFIRHRVELQAKVTSLGKSSLILGYMWLKKHNLDIDKERGQ